MVKIKTTNYMREGSTLLAYCNRNCVTRPFSRQRALPNPTHYSVLTSIALNLSNRHGRLLADQFLDPQYIPSFCDDKSVFYFY